MTATSMSDRDGVIWFDGKLVPWRDANIHVLTHSLHYGLSVFEGLRAYDTVSDARTSIGKYLAFYNGRRPHSSLDRMTPDEAYFNALMPIPAAA